MQTGRILIVEADRRLLLARADALSRDGYSVAGAATVEEAVEAAGEERFDLLVAGVGHPASADLLLQQLPPGVGALIIAAEDTVLRLARNAGTEMASFLVPPVTTGRLRRAVAAAIEGARNLKGRVRSEVLTSLQQVSGLPADKAGIGRFSKRTVETSANHTGADYVSFLARSDAGALVIKAQVGERRPGWQEVCREAAGTGEALLLDETAPDHSHLRSLMARAGVSALLCVPVTIRGEAVGAFSHLKTAPKAAFAASDLDFATILGQWSSTALENVRLRDTVQGQRPYVQRLLREIAVAQENERRRMAVEIHDGVAQWMVGASYGIRACRALASESRLDDLRRELDETSQTVQRSIKELRRTIADLRPLPLEELGLVAAVCQAGEVLAEDGITCRAEVDADLPKLTTPEEATTYRIVQEILTNVRRHSGADEVIIRMMCRDGLYRVEVTDNGQGFVPEEVGRSEGPAVHMGLIGMRERAELLDGQLMIDSSHGEGTAVRFAFPVSPVKL